MKTDNLKNYFYNKIFLLIYLIIKLLLYIYSFYQKFSKLNKINKSSKAFLAIEAGLKGWEAIDIKEIYQSACEYLEKDQVLKLKINQKENYLSQVHRFLIDHGHITHFLHDPRSGRPETSKSFFNSIIDASRLAILFTKFNVIPIVYLTDIPYRSWRIQSTIVTINSGMVVTFSSTQRLKGLLTHNRFTGPSLMPISKKTLNHLITLREEMENQGQIENIVRFTGSLYEPRTTFLLHLQGKLNQNMSVIGREIGSPRVPDEEYWKRIITASINITTTESIKIKGNDISTLNQLVYRYLEVMAAGSMLLAPSIDGVSRYFEQGKDFIAYTNVDDAYSKALYYLKNSKEAEKIAMSGHRKAVILIRSKVFWLQIDASLGSDSMI
jgi:hypothetical protein